MIKSRAFKCPCHPPKHPTKKYQEHSNSPTLIFNGLRTVKKRLPCAYHTTTLPVSPPKDFEPPPTHFYTALFCSKEGAAQVRLKLGLVNDDAGHNFTFTATPPEVAYTQREMFKTELTNIIGRNRSTTVLAAGTPAQPSKGPITAVASTLAPSKPATLAAVLPASRASTSRAASVVSDGRPILSGQDTVTDFRLRKRVLLANPELLALHKDLVLGAQITEAEFWDGREVRVYFFFLLSRLAMCLTLCVASLACRGSDGKPKARTIWSTGRPPPTNDRRRRSQNCHHSPACA